jgi:glycerophosphoryl diester phosphodiesterase
MAANKIQPKPEIHGHRGSRGTHPENTLVAFQEALQSGADWLELDLVLTQENIPVVFHDPSVSKDLCLDSQKKHPSKLLPIKTLSLNQLKTFDCGTIPNPKFKEQVAVPGQRIPTLEEVLIWASKIPHQKIKLNIETKMTAPKPNLEPSPQKFAVAIVSLLKKYNQIDNSVLQSFDFRTLRVTKEIEPKLKLSALFEKPSSICKTSKELGAYMASPNFSLVTPELVHECHSMGIQVHPWTLNAESEWKRALSLGVDGIITDYPRKLKAFLASQ